MTADLHTYGFPAGYFIIRSVAAKRCLDVTMDEVEDGTEVILYTEKESSLVETFRNPETNNQVFFIDTSGALCSRSSGHAIDVEDGRLVLRHRRPVSFPFPNAYAHPLPRFKYSPSTQEISVLFSSDPAYPADPSVGSSSVWSQKTYVLMSIPKRKPRTLIDDVSDVLSSAIATPLSFLSFGGRSPPKATPDEVFGGGIDLAEDEVLEEDRGEEGEIDDSPDAERKVRVISFFESKEVVSEKARVRRRWEIVPLRKSNARMTR